MDTAGAVEEEAADGSVLGRVDTHAVRRDREDDSCGRGKGSVERTVAGKPPAERTRKDAVESSPDTRQLVVGSQKDAAQEHLAQPL